MGGEAKRGQRQRGRPREFDRQTALNTALSLFWINGYEQTTMQMLATAIGICSPSIYCAFGSKAELFLEALGCYREAYWRPLFKRFLAEPRVERAFRLLFEEAVNILLAPGAPCGCLSVLTAANPPRGEPRIVEALAASRAETRAIILQRLEKAVEDGELAPESQLEPLAGALVNFFEGLAVQARVSESPDALAQMAQLGPRLLPPLARAKPA